MIEKNFINSHLGIKFKSFIDGKCRVWFQAKQVAQILGYKNTDHALKRHVRKYCLFVDEAGFYELVFRSKLPAAKMFREWVFTKVLPSIRKYGYYKTMDTRIKQRVIFEGKKYYKHPVFSNYAARKNGEVINVKTKKIIKMMNNGLGYLFFDICDKKLEKPKKYLQHRFVYEVFKGPIPRCFEIDHQNSIRSDNRIKNLQLLTHKQNI
ncbi:unnamed protein product, partial [Porites evermanni]